MATVTKPIALDESFNTTEQTPRNIADVLAEGLSHITGRTASEVEYDNTDSGLTSDDVQGAIDELSERPTLPSVDIQTAVDEFSTYNGGLLSECKVALSPNQDLHGYENPWVGGAGVQLIDFSNPLGVSSTLDIDYTDGDLTLTANSATGLYDLATFDGSILVGKTTYMKQTKSASASNIGHWQVVYKVNGEYVWIEVGSNPSATFAITVPSTATECVLRLLLRNGASVQQGTWVKYSKIMVATVQNPDWSPYSNICPISGHTQVEVRDEGKNEIQFPSFADKTQNGITFKRINESKIRISGTATGNAYLFDSVVAQFTLKEGTHTASCNLPSNQSAIMRVFGIVNGTASILADNIKSGSSVSFNLANDTEIFAQINVPSGSNFATGFDAECQIELGSTATAYVPYNGYQVTVNLGGTYYSGTLDVVSGVFVVDKTGVEYDGSSDENWYIVSSDPNAYFLIDVPTMTATGWKYLWSESFKTVQSASSRGTENTIWEQYRQIHIHASSAIAPSGVTSTGLAEFKAWLSNNPQKVVYELATPQSIQLSPTMVKALVGENHLDAPLDGQEITESKYRELFTWDEVESYVNAHSGGGSGMNYSTEEQVVGTWIDGKPLYQKSISINGVSIPANQTVTIYTQANISMKYFSGYLTENSTTYVIPEIGVRIKQSGDNIQISSQSGASWTISEGYVTIRYTKTTD